MTVLRHELRQGLRTALVWGIGCSLLLMLGMSVFPKVKSSMGMMEKIIEGMGPLAQAFAMDRLNYGTVMGFYAAEAGNIMSLGGGLFAALLGIGMLAKEEGRHTAEFLYPHPISRLWVLAQKFLALLVLLLVFSLIAAGASFVSIRLTGESMDLRDFLEIQAGNYLLMLSLGCITWGVSAFLSRDSLGLGIGLALLMYIIHLLINMEVAVPELKYLTPYYFTEAGKLLGPGSFSSHYLRYGMGISGFIMLTGSLYYLRKDLRI